MRAKQLPARRIERVTGERLAWFRVVACGLGAIGMWSTTMRAWLHRKRGAAWLDRYCRAMGVAATSGRDPVADAHETWSWRVAADLRTTVDHLGALGALSPEYEAAVREQLVDSSELGHVLAIRLGARGGAEPADALYERLEGHYWLEDSFEMFEPAYEPVHFVRAVCASSQFMLREQLWAMAQRGERWPRASDRPLERWGKRILRRLPPRDREVWQRLLWARETRKAIGASIGVGSAAAAGPLCRRLRRESLRYQAAIGRAVVGVADALLGCDRRYTPAQVAASTGEHVGWFVLCAYAAGFRVTWRCRGEGVVEVEWSTYDQERRVRHRAELSRLDPAHDVLAQGIGDLASLFENL